MPQNYVFDLPMRDVVRPSRRVSGSQKSSAANDTISIKFKDSATPVRITTKRFGELMQDAIDRSGIMEMMDEVGDKLAEVKLARDRAVARDRAARDAVAQAQRDRAAFDQAWADRAEHQRQQLRDMTKRAAAFYGRAGR
ncbi:hypothetical protein [Methylobacterium sp. J-030]|uniref:hypothetical protein n=1 Tax=Methylobacterium sp. J-030 TaxID=2836627 RepID=UPI001FBBDAAD|nr:hypothetical protein [Methylobacterium sp. J-030]